jgi:hypothetical protein
MFSLPETQATPTTSKTKATFILNLEIGGKLSVENDGMSILGFILYSIMLSLSVFYNISCALRFSHFRNQNGLSVFRGVLCAMIYRWIVDAWSLVCCIGHIWPEKALGLESIQESIIIMTLIGRNLHWITLLRVSSITNKMQSQTYTDAKIICYNSYCQLKLKANHIFVRHSYS